MSNFHLKLYVHTSCQFIYLMIQKCWLFCCNPCKIAKVWPLYQHTCVYLSAYIAKDFCTYLSSVCLPVQVARITSTIPCWHLSTVGSYEYCTVNTIFYTCKVYKFINPTLEKKISCKLIFIFAMRDGTSILHSYVKLLSTYFLAQLSLRQQCLCDRYVVTRSYSWAIYVCHKVNCTAQKLEMSQWNLQTTSILFNSDRWLLCWQLCH